MPLSTYVLQLSADGHSRASVREYAAAVRRWLASGLPAIEYLASLNVKPSTRRVQANILKHYIAWKGGDNPLAGMSFRAPPPPAVRPFSQDETDALLRACETELERGVILCLLHLGLRASELAGARTCDLDGETLLVRGKGGKERRLAVSGLVGPLVTVCGAGLTYQKLYRMVRAIGKRAGVADVHPHRFRHTFAERWLTAGGDSNDLRVLLGHSSWQMTQRYTRFHEGRRAIAAHERFLRLVGPGSTEALACDSGWREVRHNRQHVGVRPGLRH